MPEAAAPMSFKNIASKEKKEVQIKSVQLSGSVAMKILQHCTESDNAGACGQLLGLDVSTILEVTECFPFLASDNSEQYQLAKMRCLRDINVDSNTVGWYQSAPYKDFQTLNLLDTFISYEESVKKCVCIVCDPKDCVRGSLALKALRLSKKFMEMYKVNTSLTAKQLYDAGITWKDIFTEVPIKIENTPLVTALMAEIDRQTVLDSITASRLRLNTLPFLEKQLELMGDGIESLYLEVQDVTKYERARVRMEQAKAAWLARRQEENVARKQNGEEPLPEEDPQQFKALEPPSLVNSFLLQERLAGVCEGASTASCELLHKLNIADCLRH